MEKSIYFGVPFFDNNKVPCFGRCEQQPLLKIPGRDDPRGAVDKASGHQQMMFYCHLKTCVGCQILYVILKLDRKNVLKPITFNIRLERMRLCMFLSHIFTGCFCSQSLTGRSSSDFAVTTQSIVPV